MVKTIKKENTRCRWPLLQAKNLSHEFDYKLLKI